MKFNNFIFQKASNFPISTFTGSIIVVCARNEKIPFSYFQEMTSLREMYLSYMAKKNRLHVFRFLIFTFLVIWWTFF